MANVDDVKIKEGESRWTSVSQATVEWPRPAVAMPAFADAPASPITPMPLWFSCTAYEDIRNDKVDTNWVLIDYDCESSFHALQHLMRLLSEATCQSIR